MRLALDSAIFIYALSSTPEWSARAQALLEHIHAGRAQAVASTLCLTEVLIKPYGLSDSAGLAAQLFMEGLEHLDYIPVDTEIAIRAATLRGHYGSVLKLADAIHLAAALEHRADAFITNDHALAKLKIEGLTVTLLANWSA
ncbi:MAG TPA: type II toxin-antitoxin system VapC family toxin [Candidatus Saccharimonadia bacterium]|nr:type II toxin-antitoxin system VapC family toxin [Candidatus Saccharimonadia bacterium]